MLKHILKQIWNNRKAHGWIFAELVLVAAILWQIADVTYVETKVYHSPLGYDVENVWFFNLDNLSESSPGYVENTDGMADLLKLREQIVQHDLVENACIAFYSSPYSYGDMWTNLYPIDGDTVLSAQQSFHVRRVSPDYFDVFRVRDTEGKAITPQIRDIENAIVITADMEATFFPNERGKGKKVTCDKIETYVVSAVAVAIRKDDYAKSDPCFYQMLHGSTLSTFTQMFGNSSAELSVRMKKKLTQEEMNSLLNEMGERLTVNNLYVYSAKEIMEQRKDIIGDKQDEMKRQKALVSFVLINVFFGIIGTFWLRTQSRKEEIGLRIAVGSDKKGIRRHLYSEGLVLLALTLPFTFIYIVNLLHFDVLDTYRLPYTVGRLLITLGGTYLLIGCMIVLGISFPARKASRLQPAEALHYE